jgi:DNA-binding MarR family transcriptional regulator
MTASEASTGTTARVGRLEDVRTLSDLLPRFMRMAQAHKTQLASEGRERAALILLVPIKQLGPLRQGALAELVHADPSTVSRHVTLLVDRGLVRRVADEQDGRASRLVVTPAGEAEVEKMRQERDSVLARVTAGWTADELATFTRQLRRFVRDLNDLLPTLGTAVGGAVNPPEKDR